jgi:hypothetical protein
LSVLMLAHLRCGLEAAAQVVKERQRSKPVKMGDRH